jgi:hypothetical protein
MPRRRTLPPAVSLPEATADEVAQATAKLAAEERAWLRRCLDILALEPEQAHPACVPSVAFARDLVQIAAAERACRILWGDLPARRARELRRAAERARTADG